MREILFRGKTDKGDWLEGAYYKQTEYYGDDFEAHYIISSKDELEDNMMIAERVIPETVGQYTGLTDKNNKKIFEGDILKGERYPFCHEGDYNYFAEVIWFDNSPAFGICTFKNPKSAVRGISAGNCEYLEDFSSEDWEVIGNIHDNPELLKEGAE